MPTDRDEETGQFEEKYPQEAFLDAVRETDPATTTEVAERVDCSYDLAYRRLNALREESVVSRVTIGNTFVWSVE